MAKYRVGVIGHTGRGNYGHGLDEVWLHLPDCEVVAVADADEAGRADAARRLSAKQAYADYREMLEKERLDIVSVGPRWLDQHRDMVVAAAEHRAHIYLEKPMCRTVQEADEMIAACEKNKVKLAIAFQTRYSPRLHVVRDLIYDGKLGQILELRGRGKEDARGGGEDLWVLGSHILNLMHHFGGEPQWCFARVLAEGRPVAPADVREGNEGIGPLAGDTVKAMYGLENNATGFFASHRQAGAGRRFALQIFGSEGIVEVQTGYMPAIWYLPDPTWSPGRSGAKWMPVSSAGVGQPEPLDDGGSHGGNTAACLDLIAAIEEDRQPEANMYEGRTSVEMISAVFWSHRLGTPVTWPLAERESALRSWP